MSMPEGNVSYAAMFLLGLLGSLAHCLGMCVPLVMMMHARFAGRVPDGVGSSARSPAAGLAFPWVTARYHAARIAVYVALGAVAGAAGAVFMSGFSLGDVAGLASILFGLAVITFGLSNLGVMLPRPMQVGGSWVVRPMRAALRLPPVGGSLAAGALNGILPCPLVYAALAMAASLGSPLRGAAAMALFGSGTLPLLLAAGAGGAAWRRRAPGSSAVPWARLAGVLVLIVGMQLVLRGAAGLGVLPHGSIGRVALW